MKVLVTGGTGFVGSAMIRPLAAAGHEVRLLLRNPSVPRARDLVERHGIQTVTGSVEDPSALQLALSNMDAVVHLVGIIAPTRTWTFERVHVETTGNLTRAAREAGIRRFVHMSALGTRPGASTAYHRTKWDAEELVRQSGLDFTIFRPSIIYGSGDKFVNRFARMSRWSPVLPVIGSGRGRLQPIAVEDVAHCFVRCLSEPESIGQVYDLCGSQSYSLAELLDIILEVTGRRRFKLRIPGIAARALAKAGEMVYGRLLNLPPPLTADQLIMLEDANIGDPRPAGARFGFKPLDFREGIARYLPGEKHSSRDR